MAGFPYIAHRLYINCVAIRFLYPSKSELAIASYSCIYISVFRIKAVELLKN